MQTSSEFRRSIVLQAAFKLRHGETSKDTLCPVCNGGSTGEKAFAITLTPAAVLYHCHRASCGIKGAYRVPGSAIGNLPIKVNDNDGQYKPFTEATYPLPDNIRQLLITKYGLTGPEILMNQIGWSPESQRVLYPILGPYGARLGVVARSYSPKVSPKSLVHWEQGRLRFHTPDQKGHPNEERLFIVEDIVSSIKMARHVPSVALLGTHMERLSAMILGKKFREAVVMLDDGAAYAAFQIARNYSMVFKKIKVAPRITKDPKDMTDTEIKEVIQKC